MSWQVDLENAQESKDAMHDNGGTPSDFEESAAHSLLAIAKQNAESLSRSERFVASMLEGSRAQEIRAVALQRAVEIVAVAVTTSDAVVPLAREFEKYLRDG